MRGPVEASGYVESLNVSLHGCKYLGALLTFASAKKFAAVNFYTDNNPHKRFTSIYAYFAPIRRRNTKGIKYVGSAGAVYCTHPLQLYDIYRAHHFGTTTTRRRQTSRFYNFSGAQEGFTLGTRKIQEHAR